MRNVKTVVCVDLFMFPRYITALVFIFLTGAGLSLSAQTQHRNCLADAHLTDATEEYPDIRERRKRTEHQIDSYLSERKSDISFRQEITIPVVVHVVYRLPSQNISDQQVISQIDALNRDFNLRNGNRFRVSDPFREVMADVGITFCLANRDPQGKPTDGIVRVATDIQNAGNKQEEDGRTAIHHDELGGSDAWDEDRYLNIWVGELGGFLGLGRYPGTALHGEDGVIIDSKYFGTLGTALENRPFHLGKTTTHEVGHYFDLFHPWGLQENECIEDDKVDDTPLQSNPNYFCPDETIYSCGSQDMYLNYMDYTDDPCLALFTEGQSQRIMATLQTVRSGLLDSDGCSFTPDPSRLAERFKVYFRAEDRRLLIERDMPDDFPIDMKMYNQVGQLVARAEDIDQRIYIIDHPVQSSGIYFVALSTETESVLHKVVAVQP